MHGCRSGRCRCCVAAVVAITLALVCPHGVAGDESWEVVRGCCRTATGGTGNVLAEATYASRVNYRCKKLCVATPGCAAAERRDSNHCEVLGGAIVTAEIVGNGQNKCKCFVISTGATPEPTLPPATFGPTPTPAPAPTPAETLPPVTSPTLTPGVPTQPVVAPPSTVEPTLAPPHAEPRPEGENAEGHPKGLLVWCE